MSKTLLQNKYPFIEIKIPERNEIFFMQTEHPQWVIQIISFENQERYNAFIKEKCPGTYTPNEEQLAVAMAVSPMQEVIITSQNMKDENAIQEQEIGRAHV